MSRETDTQPGGKLYDAEQEGKNLSKKICTGDGPVTLTAAEAQTLRLHLYGLQQRADDAQLLNRAMAEALQRQGLRVTHHEGPDGSVIFDLENKPTDEPITKN